VCRHCGSQQLVIALLNSWLNLLVEMNSVKRIVPEVAEVFFRVANIDPAFREHLL
jgi:hypothetical protein